MPCSPSLRQVTPSAPFMKPRAIRHPPDIEQLAGEQIREEVDKKNEGQIQR